MSIYNAMFEAASKLKKGAGTAAGIAEGAAKSTRDAARTMGKAAKQSETVKAAGPALGKVARYAAYPAGLGAGVGVGAWAAGAGAASAIDATGTAVKKSWTPEDLKDGTMKFFGVLLLLVFLGIVVYLYRYAKGV